MAGDKREDERGGEGGKPAKPSATALPVSSYRYQPIATARIWRAIPDRKR